MTVEQDNARGPDGSELSAELGPLPPYLYGSECGPLERVWTERDMREYATAAVAAERERLIEALRREALSKWTIRSQEAFAWAQAVLKRA